MLVGRSFAKHYARVNIAAFMALTSRKVSSRDRLLSTGHANGSENWTGLADLFVDMLIAKVVAIHLPVANC